MTFPSPSIKRGTQQVLHNIVSLKYDAQSGRGLLENAVHGRSSRSALLDLAAVDLEGISDALDELNGVGRDESQAQGSSCCEREELHNGNSRRFVSLEAWGVLV